MRDAIFNNNIALDLCRSWTEASSSSRAVRRAVSAVIVSGLRCSFAVRVSSIDIVKIIVSCQRSHDVTFTSLAIFVCKFVSFGTVPQTRSSQLQAQAISSHRCIRIILH